MTDLSQLSTEELMRMRQQPQQSAPMDLTSMSTDELLKLRTGSTYGEAEEAQLRQQMPRPLPSPTLAQEAQTTAPMPAIYGAMDLAHQGANLIEQGVGALTGNEAIQGQANRDVAGMGQREREYQMARKLTGRDQTPDVGRAIGSVGANLAALPSGGAATLPGRILQGAGAGAMSGALAPVTDETKPFFNQVGANALTGTEIGGAVPAAMGAAARVISPLASTNPDVQELLSKGVRLTPGQMLGGRLQQTEDKLTSLPILGDVITSAKQKGFEDLNRAAINDSLADIRQTLPKTVPVGHDAVSYAYDRFNDAYDAVKQHLSLNANNMVTTISQAGGQAAQSNILPQKETEQLVNILKNQITKLSPNQQVDGETIKGIDSMLAKFARGYTKSQELDTQNLGHAIEDVRSALRADLAQANPRYAEQLQAIDSGYAKYLRVERAARAAGKDGVFTPGQYDQAVKMMAGGARGSQASRGQALQQNLSSAGAKVLPSQYPNSGTPGRMFLNAGALGGGAMLGLEPMTAAAVLGGASAPYIGPGRTAAEYAIARRPQGAHGMAQMLRGSSTPQLSGASSILARLLANPSP